MAKRPATKPAVTQAPASTDSTGAAPGTDAAPEATQSHAQQQDGNDQADASTKETSDAENAAASGADNDANETEQPSLEETNAYAFEGPSEAEHVASEEPSAQERGARERITTWLGDGLHMLSALDVPPNSQTAGLIETLRASIHGTFSAFKS